MKMGDAVRRLGGRHSRETIRRWCERGYIEGAYRAPGGWWEIPEAGLDAFVERLMPQKRHKRRERHKKND